MIRISLTLLALLVAGCADTDPYRRTDVWYPSGSNAGNIAAMAARPGDLISGRGRDGADARVAAGAVDRVWQDRTKPLFPASASSSTTGGAAASGGQN
jgi:type IV pilus biogenesis protein CpaD/CtpE